MYTPIEDVKVYLRVDSSDEDDAVIAPLIDTAQRLVLNIMRTKQSYYELEENPVIQAATYHAIAYLYENRENADMNGLTLQLRSLLQAEREAAF